MTENQILASEIAKELDATNERISELAEEISDVNSTTGGPLQRQLLIQQYMIMLQLHSVLNQRYVNLWK